MTDQEITALRLHNQLLSRSPQASPADIVRHMGAMQAQDYYGSLWALGVRTGCTRDEVDAALRGQKIIRTWPQRGTLHLVPAQDAKWLVGLSAERILKGAATRRGRLGLADGDLEKAQDIVVEMLSTSPLVTRPRLLQKLADRGVSVEDGRGYHILWYLAQTGVTYIGPMEAKQQTIGLLDVLVTNPTVLPRLDALAELAKRYFVSHGPATMQDFMWWSGLTASDARLGVAAHEGLLESVTAGGNVYWMATITNEVAREDRAYLLPGFDEYMLGYKDRSAALAPEFAQKIAPGSNGMFLPTVALGGRVVGTWKPTVKKDHVVLAMSLFRDLKAKEFKLLEAPAQDYGHFVGLDPRIVIS